MITLKLTEKKEKTSRTKHNKSLDSSSLFFFFRLSFLSSIFFLSFFFIFYLIFIVCFCNSFCCFVCLFNNDNNNLFFLFVC